jgi:hypothetical protein
MTPLGERWIRDPMRSSNRNVHARAETPLRVLSAPKEADAG